MECFPVGAMAVLAYILPQAIREEQAQWPKPLQEFASHLSASRHWLSLACSSVFLSVPLNNLMWIMSGSHSVAERSVLTKSFIFSSLLIPHFHPVGCCQKRHLGRWYAFFIKHSCASNEGRWWVMGCWRTVSLVKTDKELVLFSLKTSP